MCKYDPDARVLATWTKVVESYCPTLNSISTNSKNNHKYRKWRQTWEEYFGDWLKAIPPAKALRRVTLVRHFGAGKRAFDAKNFAGGAKPLLDTLTNFGAIYDDSETWVQDNYVQLKSLDGRDYIEVRLEELAP